MAHVKMISVSYDRKVNLGDFNSLRVEVTAWVDVPEADDAAEVIGATRQLVRNHCMNEIGRSEPGLAAKTVRLFLGLPVELQVAISEEAEEAQEEADGEES